MVNWVILFSAAEINGTSAYENFGLTCNRKSEDENTEPLRTISTDANSVWEANKLPCECFRSKIVEHCDILFSQKNQVAKKKPSPTKFVLWFMCASCDN